MGQCSCNSTDIFNTGVPNCQPLAGVIKRIILYPTQDASGNLNRIDLNSIPDNAAILALINEDDPLKRLYPVAASMVNVTNVRSEPQTEDFDNGDVIKIKDGVKSFHGEFVKQGATLADNLNKVECVRMSAFLVDSNGALIGDKSVSGYLTPIAIKDGTWNVQTLDTTDSTVAKVTLDLQWSDAVGDGDIGFLTESDFESGVNWLKYNGLVGLNGSAAGTITVNGFTMKITNNYGSVTGQGVSGLELADFVCNETSPTPAPEPLASATESSTEQGLYTFVYTTPVASGDLLELSIAPTTLGYDDSNIKSQVITTP